jgi:hypothetical protein
VPAPKASQLFLDNRSQLAPFAQQPLETRDRILPVFLCCAQVRKIIPEDMGQTGIDVQLGLNTIFLSQGVLVDERLVTDHIRTAYLEVGWRLTSMSSGVVVR